jgi:regulator of sigma E protease
MSSLKYGIWTVDTLMKEIGLKNGDKIVSINGEPVDYFENLGAQVILGNDIIVERDGKQQEIKLPVNLVERLIESKRRKGYLLQMRLPTYVGEYRKDDTLYGKRADCRRWIRLLQLIQHQFSFMIRYQPFWQTIKMAK